MHIGTRSQSYVQAYRTPMARHTSRAGEKAADDAEHTRKCLNAELYSSDPAKRTQESAVSVPMQSLEKG